MAQTIKLKRSANTNLSSGQGIPTTSQLDLGEVAINTYHGKMYIKKNDGSDSIVEVGAADNTKLPLAGGTLTGTLAFGDNTKLKFGNSQDLQIYHDGGNSRILENGTGFLAIGTNGTDIRLTGHSFNEFMAKFEQDGPVTLYHNNAAKIATTSTGINVTGDVLASGRIKTTNGLFQANAGDQYLRQYAVSSGSGTQSFLLGKIKSSNSSDGGVTGIVKAAYDYGDQVTNVNIHFTFSQRSGLQRGHWWYENTDDDTSTDVVSVKVIDDGSNNYYVWLHVGDYVKCFVETTWRQVSSSHITDSGSISASTITSGTTLFDTANDPTSEHHIGKLYAHNAVDVAGTITANSGGGAAVLGSHLDLGDNQRARFGASDDLQIYHDGTNSIIYEGGTGDLQLRGNGGNTTIMNGGGTETLANFGNNGTVTLYHDNAQKLATTSTGIAVTGNVAVSGTVDGIDIAARDGVLTSTTTTAGAALPKTGGAMTGNLLVGTTSTSVKTDTSTAGHNFFTNGETAHARSGNTVMSLNRQTNDGTILELRKGGTPVGVLASRSGDLVIRTGDTGITFNDAVDAIIPHHATNIVDNQIDLGYSSHRFKDLHLAGTANVGGNLTVSGNLQVTGTTTQTGSIVTNSNFTGLSDANSSNATDFGFYGKYVESSTTKYAGVYYDASVDNTFKFFCDTQTSPTTTVNESATGYALANIQAAGLTVSSGTINSSTDVALSRDGSTSNRLRITNGTVHTDTDLSVTGNLSVSGNFNITGDINQTSVTTLDVTDKTITVANNAGSAANANDAGLIVDTGGTNPSLLYKSSGDKFVFNKPLDVTGTLTSTALTVGNASFSGAITANAGVVVDNITIDANKIATNQAGGHNGNFTIDASGDIILDAAGNDIQLKANGTTFGQLTNDSGQLIIYNAGYQMLKGNSGANALFQGNLHIPNGSLMVGATTAPSSKFELNSSGANSVYQTFTRSTGGTNEKYWQMGIGTNHRFSIGRQVDANNSLSEYLSIDSSGNVGIGTSSPSEELHISSALPKIQLQDSDGTNQYGQFYHSAGITAILARNNTADGTIVFQKYDGTTTDETMRIDSSGNVIVSGTAAGQATSVALHNTGYVHAVSAHQMAGIFDRRDSDGDILLLRKQGASVGSIGTLSGDLFIGTGNTTLTFTDGSRDIMPTGTNGAQASDVISLGNANNRFKDLHLSGTANAPLVITNDIKATGSGGVSFQTDEGTKRLEISDAGNVNIYNGSLMVGATTAPASLLNLSHATAPELRFSRTGTGQQWVQSIDSSGRLLFLEAASTGGTLHTRMSIDDTGEAGIGVTPASGIQLQIGNAANSSAITRITNGTVHVDLTASSSGKAFLEVGTNHPLVLATNATERMRISNSGQVGINRTSFLNTNIKLEVGGADNVPLIAAEASGVRAGLGVHSSGLGLYVGTTNVIKATSGGAVTFNSEFTFPTADGNANQLLKTDGSGNMSWVTVAGTGTATSLADADNNTKIQVEESADENKIRFDTAGSERMIIDATGNVGIGTTSPTDGKLQVFSSSTSDWAGYFYNQNTGGIGLHVETNSHGTQQLLRLSSLNGSGGSNTVKMVVRADGNVGIGTTNPSSLLHIQSNNSTTNDAVNMMFLTALSTGTTTTGFGPAIVLQAERNSGVNQNVGKIRSVAEVNSGTNISSGLSFETGTAGVLNERMRITHGGNVGIGTTAPQHKLDTVGTIRHTSNIVSNTVYKAFSIGSNRSINDYGGLNKDYWAISLATPGSSTDGGGSAHGYGALKFSGVSGSDTGLDDVLVLNYNGNVGIGTAAPSEKLHIHSGGIYSTPVTYAANQDNWALKIGASNNAGWDFAGIKLRVNSGGGPRMSLMGVGQVEAMSIVGGNVGIGTTTPDAKLRIDQDAGAVGLKVTGGSGGTNIAQFIRDVGANASVNINASGADPQIQFVSPTNTFALGVNSNTFEIADNSTLGSNTRFAITNAGNVGIGETSPDGLLHLKGGTATGDASHILFENTQGSKVFAIGGGSTGVTNSNLFFRNVTDNTRPMVITDAGNVGIGTDSPQAQLQVKQLGINVNQSSVASTSQYACDSMSATVFRSARYTVQITNVTDSTYHATEILLIHDGTTPAITEFATIFTGSAAEATFDADIAGGNVRLLATPASSDNMQFKVVRHSILV